MSKQIRELIGKTDVQQATGCHFNTFDRYERGSIEQRHAMVRGRIQREQRKDDRRRDFHDQQV